MRTAPWIGTSAATLWPISDEYHRPTAAAATPLEHRREDAAVDDAMVAAHRGAVRHPSTTSASLLPMLYRWGYHLAISISRS